MKKYENKLMECMARAVRLNKCSRRYSKKKVLKCKKAAQIGDYETAYKELLDIFEGNLRAFGRGGEIMTDWSGGKPCFTLVYGMPCEAIGKEQSLAYALSAVYNLQRTGHPSPCQLFSTREESVKEWVSKMPINEFYLRMDNAHEHLGELRIISQEEYETAEGKWGYQKFSSQWNDNPLDSLCVEYKVLKREWKHDYIFIKCGKHHYLYTWQFCQG